MTLTGALDFPTTALQFNNGTSSAAANVVPIARTINLQDGAGIQLNGSSPILPPVSVTVTPAAATLYGGQTQQFSAAVANGCTGNVNWSVSPSSGAGTISASGLYTAPATVTTQQSVTVTATSQSDTTKIATATITLMPPVSVSVAPATVTLYGNQTQQFTASVANAINPAVTWSVSPASGAGTVSTSGVYTAPASVPSAQTVTVTATSQQDPTKWSAAVITLEPPVTVTVAPPTATLYGSQTQQFTATVGNATNTAVSWSVAPAGAGSISATGFYTAPASITAQQTVTVTATSQADSTKSAAATVTLMPPITVTVAPGSGSLGGGQTLQFTATVANTGNSAVSWSISPSGSGSISAAGLYTAPAIIANQATVTITATSQADTTKSASAAVTLNPVTVSLAPGNTLLYANQAQQFTATVGNATNIGVTWSISPAGAGTVSTSGSYMAPATVATQLTVTVTATSQADTTKSATATITLEPPVSVTIAPANGNLYGGGTKPFSATVANDPTNAGVTWTVSPATGAGTISTTGVYSAPASVASQQTVTITASSVVDSSKSATATVTLLPPITVTVAPATANLNGGQTQQFNATVTNDPTNAGVTWTLSPPTGAGTINSSGLYTAPATVTTQQTVTITAASQVDSTKTGTATVTLAPITVTSAPATAALYGGQTQQFTATVSNTANQAVTWTVSPATGAGTINSSGLYTAPATIATQQTVTITATSQADTTKTATSTVTLYPPIVVTVGPATASLYPAQTQQFSATVTNALSTAVTWSIAPAGTGTIDTTGLYTAPAMIATPQTVTITAKSQADGATLNTATVTLLPAITVTVSPATVLVSAGQTAQFTATVTNDPADAGVTWALTPTGFGTISTNGLYTAPAPVSAAQSITVAATSVTDTSKTATATISLSPCAMSSYSHVRAIVIDHAKVSGSDQTNFPVLISGTYSYLATAANGGGVQNASGYDIIFTSDFAGANKLDHELESYNPATGAITAWVRIPTLSHTADTVIYLNYGNGAITTSQQNPHGVWDANYAAVVHFPQTSGSYSGSLADSTANQNNLNNIAGSPAGAVGPFDGAAALSGSQYLYRNSPAGVSTGSAPRTVESWVKSPAANSELAGYGSNNANGHRFAQLWNGTCFATEIENDGTCANFALADGNWHYLVSVLPGGQSTAAGILLYGDGVPLPSSGGTTTLNTDQGMLAVGTIPGAPGAANMTGSIAEVRVSNIDRSAGWIATEYASMHSPATFYTVYPENQIGVSVAPATGTLFGGQTQQFGATTIGNCSTGFTWSVNPAGVGTVDGTGLYTAPATVSTQQTVSVTATSQVDATKSAAATVTLLPPVSVTLTPQTGSVSAGQTLQFTANVIGNQNNNVAWTISPAGVGSINSSGLFTAPIVEAAQQTVAITATSVANSAAFASATLTLLAGSFSPIRVNAGGPAYIDPQGVFWSASNGFNQPGIGFVSPFSFTPPAGSNVPVIYQTGMNGNVPIQYQTNLPNGQYVVMLKFADGLPSASTDIFDVSINGTTVLPRFSPFALAGQSKPIDETFPVTVSNGQITIVFTPDSSLALINAIQIVAAGSVEVLPLNPTLDAQQVMQFTANVQGAASQQVTWTISPSVGTISSTGLYTTPPSLTAPASVTVTATSVSNPSQVGTSVITLNPVTASAFVPIRVNAGGPAYTDPQGVFWSASNGFNQPSLGFVSPFSFTPPAGSNVPVIYQTGMNGNVPVQYLVNVPNGQYVVTLKFADGLSSASYDVFDVSINGVSVLPKFSPFALVGQSMPIDETFPVNVTNNEIIIVCSPDGGVALINAIQIVAADTLQLFPASTSLWRSQTLQFEALGDLGPNSPTWSISPPGVGSVSASGVYTAPAAITVPESVSVTVTSSSVPNISATSTVNLFPPVQVSVAPATVTLQPNQTQQFNATLANNAGTGVTWSLSQPFGSISSSGLYTAPAIIPTATTVTVIATSAADGTTASAAISLAPGITISVAPATITVGPSEQQRFTAKVAGAWNTGVTWSVSPNLGSISASGVYAAPSSITSTTTVTIAATSVASATALGTATVTLSPAPSGVTVTVTPSAASVFNGQTQQFTAAVSGSSNTAVTWSVIPPVGTITSSGLYTAPANLAAAQNVTVQAVSVAFPTAAGSASVTISQTMPNSYSYRRAIDIDHTKVVNSDQSSFAVLVSGTYPYLATVANGGKVQNANGYDIIFSSDCAGEQQLAHEIASYNPATGAVSMWVVLPLVSHTTDTVFYISYGNSAITTSQENRPAADAARSTTGRSSDWLATAANNQNSPSTFYTVYPENTNSIAPPVTTLGPSQTQQFAALFTVGAGTTAANPLVLLGASPTPSPAESVALSADGSTAYVCDNNEVSVFNVTNPASPVFLEPVLAADILNDGIAHCTIQNRASGPSLLAFVDANNTGIGNNPAFVAFGLQNPTAPQLVAGTGIPKRFFQQPVYSADGNTAYVPTNTIGTSFDSWSGQNGDVVAVDVTNLSAPTVLSTMETIVNGQYGGANAMFGAALANPTTLLVGGSTSTGAANNGVGELVVADVSNRSAISTVTTLPVPGTVQIYTPVLQGNLAVALGDTGGWTASGGFFGPGDPIVVTYLGNLVVTTFDITNPRSPAILASIVLPYPVHNAGPAVQIGNNLFLFGGAVDSSGNNLLLLVDTTNPRSPIVTPYAAPAPVTNMVVSGRLLHVSAGAAGYAIFQIPGVTGSQFTLSGSCGGPVTWTVNPTTAGTIAASGLYTAPASIPANQTVTITATGQIDPTMTASATVNLTNTLTLSLSAAPGPYVIGGSAGITATVTTNGAPVSGISVTFTLTGANAGTQSATTDGNGHATLSYSGTARGTDTIQASADGFTSGAVSAYWVAPASAVSATSITGEFFTATSCPSGCEAFVTPATQVPSFAQTFPDLMFNATSSTPNPRSFTDAASGGSIVAQGNGFTPGTGSMVGFAVVFRGNLVIAQAGSYTINVTSQDGFLFGVGNGAARVSGININAPAATVFGQYPVMGANNGPSTNAPAPIVVSLPAAGSYPFEIDYQSGTGGPLSLVVTTGQGTSTVNVPPLDSLVLTGNANPPYLTGQAAGFTVQVTDETGSPAAGVAVTVNVSGSNPQTLQGTTDSTGKAVLSYKEQTAGTDVLQASATLNGLGLVSNQFTAPWLATEAPTITATGDQTLQMPNVGSYSATVTDPAAPAGGTIAVQWSEVSGPGTVVFDTPAQLTTHAAYPAPGSYVLQIVATDALGSSTLQIPLTVQPPVTAAQGWILSPIDHMQVTGTVPITLISGVTLTSGTLSYYEVMNPAAVTTLNANTTGTGQIGVLDTTTLANGTYYIVLNATNSAEQTQGSGVTVIVSGDYKPGRVTTTVTDLVVPAPGLPIQISRVYDSLVRGASSDFGYGWSLSVKLQMEIAPTQDITLTLNGQRRTFFFTPAPNILAVTSPAYTGEPGLYGTLVATQDNCGGVIVKVAATYLCAASNLSVYQPQQLVYTDPYGRQYTIDGQGNLNSLKDLAGNTLTVTPTGITASNSLSVPFVRDAQGRITQITDPLGNVYSYAYDTSGNLASVTYPGIATPAQYGYDPTHLYTSGTDPRGNALPSATYDASGRLQTVTDALGQKTSYAYNLSSNTTTTTNPDGGTVVEVDDSYGKPLTMTDALGHTTTNVYDANHNLTSVTDALGHTTSYMYDSNGNRTSVTYPKTATSANTTSSTQYNAASEPAQTTDELGNVRTFTYDTKFWPKLASDSIGSVVSFTFNGNGTMAAKAVGYDLTAAPGVATAYTYDQYGNMTGQTDALGRQTGYVYDTLGRLTSTTAPVGGTTTNTYDALGHLKTVAAPLARNSSYTYDANGNKLTETDANGHVTTYAYDPLNRVSQATYADSTTMSYTYDFRNNVLTTKDQAGRVTQNVHDLAGRLTSTTLALGTPDAATTGYTYYRDGRKATMTDPLGQMTTYNYDAAGRLTSTVDAQGHTTSYAYDDASNQTQVTDPNGHKTQQQYDARRRLTEATYDDGTTTLYSYDGPGNLTSVTDQANNVVQYTYDVANQLKSVIQTASPNPQNMTAYNYDKNGNLTTQADANSHTTSNGFDLLNELNSETLPAGPPTQTRTYDPAGNLISLTDYNGKTTTYTYDSLNRLTTKIPDPTTGDATVGFTYTSTGRRATMTDASGTTTYTYDNLDRLKSKATPEGTLNYTYDAQGNLATMSSSNVNGTSVVYSYDNLKRLSTIVDNNLPTGHNTTTYSYDPASNLVTATYPNGVQNSLAYDDLNRLKSLNGYTYQSGPAGNKTSAAEASSRAVNWTYDGIFRLTQEVITLNPRSANGSATYGLDSVGNRLSQTSTLPGIPTGAFTYDMNDRLSTETYDNNGNTLVSGARTFTYDFEGGLKSAMINGSQITFVYDGDGNRVAKSANGVTTRFLIDDLNPTGYAQVVEEVVTGAVQRMYTFGRQRISQDQVISGSWTSSFYGYDGLGSVRMLTDATGTVTDTYDYDAWGNQLSSNGSTPNVYLYDGERYDAELALYYLRARYFNPLTGRFLTRDPNVGDVQQPGTLHRYLYGLSDPIDNRDPSGRATLPILPPSSPGPQPVPPQAPNPRQGSGANIEYVTIAAFVSLSAVAILPPVRQEIQCRWQNAVDWLSVTLSAASGLDVSGGVRRNRCRVTATASDPSPSPTPGTPPPGRDPDELCRGRMQAQGPDVEASVRWSQPIAPSSVEGLLLLQELKGKLTPRQLARRALCFAQAEKYVGSPCPQAGGCYPPGQGFPGLKGAPACDLEGDRRVRVDVEILSCRTFR